jgi:hypothetical protein
MNLPVPGQYLWNMKYVTAPPAYTIIKYQNDVFSINNAKLYDFNPSSGILKISMPPKDLELFLISLGEMPANGEDLVMPSPPETDFPHVRFKNVKSIESAMEFEEEGLYLLNYEPVREIKKEKKDLTYAINSFFKRKHNN